MAADLVPRGNGPDLRSSPTPALFAVPLFPLPPRLPENVRDYLLLERVNNLDVPALWKVGARPSGSPVGQSSVHFSLHHLCATLAGQGPAKPQGKRDALTITAMETAYPGAPPCRQSQETHAQTLPSRIRSTSALSRPERSAQCQEQPGEQSESGTESRSLPGVA